MSQQQNDTPFVPPPPPSTETGGSFYPPYVLESKRKEAESDARNALILSIIGLFVCGIILGLIALPKANNAISIIDIYGVARDSRGLAVTAKVLAIIEVFGWAAMVILQIVLAVLTTDSPNF